MKTSLKRQAKTGRIIGSDTLRAISAVEGIRLTPQSNLRLKRMKSAGMTPDQSRAEVRKAYAPQKKRK
jgi:hypothetical protein